MHAATPRTGAGTACRTMVTMRLSRALVATTAMTALVAVSGALATAPAGAAPAADPGVDALISQRIANPRIGSDVGLIVLDAATGSVVSDHGGEQLMLPASNMKIITAVDILATMGADARFTTRVAAGASIADIVLEGGADPLLTSSNLQSLARRTAKRLAADVPVVVHVDDDLFPATGRAPGWTTSYLPYVAAPVEALARLGDYSSDPSGNAARVFVAKLRSLGIPASLGGHADAGTGATLAAFDGHSVADAVAVMLSRSENNVAEVLFRHVARSLGLEPSWAGGRRAAMQTLARLGLDASGMTLNDGSGLSRKDRVSPRFLADVLRLARVTKPEPFTVMFLDDALPVAGRTGTLATAYGRFVTRHAICARDDVQAKTGSLFDTIALSGRARTATGGERLFSILVNDRPQRYSALSTRQALDGLTATITGCWN
jgi:D-alanyl-D-alanine carboxypeptidase/D-alanyl-D-alanine-endopeptidase (penicillin-binding protein 4)